MNLIILIFVSNTSLKCRILDLAFLFCVLYMLKNLSVDLFVILFMLHFFRFIPNYILVLIVLVWFFDAFAIYFNDIGSKMINKNKTLKRFVAVYLKYAKPLETTMLFFDTVSALIVFIFIFIYYYYLHGFC